MQVASRIMVVWGLLYMFPHPEVQQGYGFVTCVYAWSITECIRYSFYALKEFGLEPYLLIWARGELLVFWNSLPYAKELRKTYYQLLILIMINYAPGFFNMYTYMIKQRKKVIGGGGAKKSGTKTGSNKAMLSPKKAKKL
ncbi:hypothetical protein H4219_005095 [Mycoemilia scoparia]|uniref:Very-long-chain (3R)-3-hydroxyacyl-CoA dehydratase n=1 Tax=Mycoemilia scoparia TaxID=417184 RepID=A0A9W7ZYW2_9FUNG|nr:hypothetical protein H4219_005095 [Mycoemilia scoparia]